MKLVVFRQGETPEDLIRLSEEALVVSFGTHGVVCPPSVALVTDIFSYVRVDTEALAPYHWKVRARFFLQRSGGARNTPACRKQKQEVGSHRPKPRSRPDR